MKFSGKIDNGSLNKQLNFGGNLDHESGYWSTYASGSVSCLGGGMLRPSASSYKFTSEFC